MAPSSLGTLRQDELGTVGFSRFRRSTLMVSGIVRITL
jgi:hypothetical protein